MGHKLLPFVLGAALAIGAAYGLATKAHGLTMIEEEPVITTMNNTAIWTSIYAAQNTAATDDDGAPQPSPQAEAKMNNAVAILFTILTAIGLFALVIHSRRD